MLHPNPEGAEEGGGRPKPKHESESGQQAPLVIDPRLPGAGGLAWASHGRTRPRAAGGGREEGGKGGASVLPPLID
jgi:hypothetical protein